MNNFYRTRQILNEKLVEIWAYNQYTSTTDKIRDDRIRNYIFIIKLSIWNICKKEDFC